MPPLGQGVPSCQHSELSPEHSELVPCLACYSAVSAECFEDAGRQPMCFSGRWLKQSPAGRVADQCPRGHWGARPLRRGPPPLGSHRPRPPSTAHATTASPLPKPAVRGLIGPPNWKVDSLIRTTALLTPHQHQSLCSPLQATYSTPRRILLPFFSLGL